MFKFTKALISAFLIIFCCSSCSIGYRVLLGVDSTPEWQTKKEKIKKSKQYKVAEPYNLVMDTANYFKGLSKIYSPILLNLKDSEDSLEYKMQKNVFKDDAQPTQFRMYDNEGNEIFKIVNCYVERLIPLNWNVDKCFNTFPPKINEESLNIHNFNIDFLLSNSSSIAGQQIKFSDLPKADYYGVVLWNDFMKRPSKKLIKTVQQYISASNKSVVIIYINNHNSVIWDMLDAKNKEIVNQQTCEIK